MSGHLLVIGIELLVRAIKNDDNIKGINLGEKVIKVFLYADDTTVFVRDLDSVAHLLTLLQKFKNFPVWKSTQQRLKEYGLGSWLSLATGSNKSSWYFLFL